MTYVQVLSNIIMMAQGRNTQKVARSPQNGDTSPTQLPVARSTELSIKVQFTAVVAFLSDS